MQASMETIVLATPGVDSTFASDDGLTAAALAVVQSIGLELGIFAVTLVLAAVARHSGLAPKPKGCAAFVACSPRTASTQRSPEVSKTPVPPRQRPLEASKACSPLSSPARAAPLSSSPLVDAVMTSAAGGSVKALTRYAELRSLQPAAFADALRSSIHSSEEVFSAVLLIAGRTDYPDVMVRLFDDMASVGVVRTLALYESAMRLLAKKNRPKEALQIYACLELDGLDPSAVTLGCLVNFAAADGDLQQAVQFFDRLAAKEVPSIRAYMSVLRVLGQMRNWQRSLSVFRDCQSHGVADSTVLNIVLATAVNVGAVKEAAILLEEAASQKPPIVDTVSFNTVIKGAAKRNDADTALRLVKRMRALSVRPNAITFNTAMDANVRCSRTAEAWLLFALMRAEKLRPDKFTCSTLLKGVRQSTLAQLGLLLDALEGASDQCSPALSSNILQSVAEQARTLEGKRGCDSAEATALLLRAREMRWTGM